MKDILYTPQLTYSKNYYTEGSFEDLVKEKEKLNITINNIEPLISVLPNSIKTCYLSPYYALKNEFENMTIPEVNEEKKEPVMLAPTADMFYKGPDIYIDIDDPLAEKNEIIGYRYYIDFLDVYKDYLDKLNKCTEDFIYSTLSALSLGSLNSSIRDYSTSAIKNEALAHVSDYLIKSDISLGQMNRLHKKLFDIDSTILHIRNIKLSAALIQRYYSIDKKEVKNDLDVTNNILLEESKRIADKKYELSFYNLYRYLNSNVILMNESLASYTKQNKAMLIINKGENE